MTGPDGTSIALPYLVECVYQGESKPLSSWTRKWEFKPQKESVFDRFRQWRRLRQLVNPAFSSVALRSYGYTMLRLTETLIDSYKTSSGSARNIYDDMNQLTLKIATKCLFGEEMPMRSNEVIQNIAGSVERGQSVGRPACLWRGFLLLLLLFSFFLSSSFFSKQGRNEKG